MTSRDETIPEVASELFEQERCDGLHGLCGVTKPARTDEKR